MFLDHLIHGLLMKKLYTAHIYDVLHKDINACMKDGDTEKSKPKVSKRKAKSSSEILHHRKRFSMFQTVSQAPHCLLAVQS